MWTEKIKTLINDALNSLQLPEIDFTVEHPTIESHGDYASNVAMVLFPKLKLVGNTTYSNPHALADAIVSKINSLITSLTDYQTIFVAGPGFINFTLKTSVHLLTLNEIGKEKDNYGKSSQYLGKKIVVEYTDPNPFKEFHIGHLYSNIVGETIAKLFEANGATVWRADYFGDVGMHVAKSVWGLLQQFQSDHLTLSQLEKKPLKERIRYLGQAYALGATTYEADEVAQADMKNLNAVLYSASIKFVTELTGKTPTITYPKPTDEKKYDPDTIYEIYVTCRKWSLEYFETIYERLGTKFDGYYPESVVGEFGYHLIKSHPEYFENGDGGATIFPGKKYGLHDRVFINSLGIPTYECKELGLVSAKYQDFPYDQSIVVTGNEINDYFTVLLKAMSLVEPKLGAITKHIGHGMVRLPEGKMSSRTGKVTTGESLLDAAKDAALAIIDQINPSLETKDTVADLVGLAAIRYAFLKTSIGKDVIFNFKESISFSGDSGPYLQYTYARCSSVLTKANTEVIYLISPDNPINSEETSLLKWLTRFPEIIEDAANDLTPHRLCEYSYELAQRYNTLYNQHTIIGNELRLGLTQATRQVLKNALTILGIKCPEKM